MKKTEYQKLQDFKNRHSLTYPQFVQIMTEYANTPDEFAGSFFCEKYNLTEHIFYTMRDFAIIFMLVSPEACRRIRTKAFRNQSCKNKFKSHTASLKHYQSLIERRKEFLSSFSDDEIRIIAMKYADGVDLFDISKEHNMSTHTVRKLLAISLTNHLVCEDLYLRIKARSDSFIYSQQSYHGCTAENLWTSYSSYK